MNYMKKFIPGQIIKQFNSKKGKNITFRYPKWEDLDGLTDYINEISQEDTFIIFSGETITKEEETKYLANLLAGMESGNLLNILAVVGDTIAGSSDVERDVVSRERRKHVASFGISLKKDFRGEGIGEELMKTVIEETKKTMKNIRILTLDAYGMNTTAINLYKKIGFKELGTLPKGVLYKGEYIDDIKMYYQITERETETSSA